MHKVVGAVSEGRIRMVLVNEKQTEKKIVLVTTETRAPKEERLVTSQDMSVKV